MLSPMDEETASQYITVVDLDDWVGDSTGSISIEAMMKQAAAALHWKQAHPNQDLPEALPEATIYRGATESDKHGIEQQSDSSEIQATLVHPCSSETMENSSIRRIVFPRRDDTCCKLKRKSILMSLLVALIAILSVVAISVSLRSTNRGGGGNATISRGQSPPIDSQTPHDLPPENTTMMTTTAPGVKESMACGTTPCTQESDCADASNLHGLNQDCGQLSCISGLCQFNAWSMDGNCDSTNFVRCHGNDMLCTKGPTELSFAASCTGFANNECIYQWCPGTAATSSGASSFSSLSLPTECGTPCRESADCEDAKNLQGLNSACGEMACVSGFCQFNAWNSADNCSDNNFVFCGGDDAICQKGPSELTFEGTCTGFQNNECIYRWCPGI